jgi:hypothetical protein
MSNRPGPARAEGREKTASPFLEWSWRKRHWAHSTAWRAFPDPIGSDSKPGKTGKPCLSCNVPKIVPSLLCGMALPNGLPRADS